MSENLPFGDSVTPHNENLGGTQSVPSAEVNDLELRLQVVAKGQDLLGHDLMSGLLYEAARALGNCREALGDIEILIYEAQAFDKTLTKDAARRFLAIAEIAGWDMPWVEEMRANV